MKQFTLRLPEKHCEELGALVEEDEFPSRSEAVRTAIRRLTDEYDARRKVKDQQRIRGDRS